MSPRKLTDVVVICCFPPLILVGDSKIKKWTYFQVPGSGLQLARALAPDHASRNSIDRFAVNTPEFSGANIGSIPPLFDSSINNYQHLEFLKLILFYNKDMGIVAGNGVPESWSQGSYTKVVESLCFKLVTAVWFPFIINQLSWYYVRPSSVFLLSTSSGLKTVPSNQHIFPTQSPCGYPETVTIKPESPASDPRFLHSIYPTHTVC